MRSPVKHTWQSEEGTVIDTRLELLIVGSWCVIGGLMWWGGYHFATWLLS